MLLLNCMLLKCSLQFQGFLVNTFASRYLEWPCKAEVCFLVYRVTLGQGFLLCSFIPLVIIILPMPYTCIDLSTVIAA